MRNLKPQASSLKPSRPGVTILEVLFAIGVTAIGLLGAVAILPVANYQARRSRSLDTVAAAGRGALSRFDAMRMRQPDHWIVYHVPNLNIITQNWASYTQTWAFNTTPAIQAWQPFPMSAPTGGNPRLLWQEFQRYQQNVQTPGATLLNSPTPPARNWFGGVDSFCIDPRFVAANLTVSASLPLLNPAACTFPALTANAAIQSGNTPPPPFMWRTTLTNNAPSLIAPGALQSVGAPYAIPPAMSKIMADSVFVINDDTAFDRDNDRAKPARIGFDKLTGAPLIDGKRRIDGHYSWMATLVPERNSTGTFQPGRSAGEYSGLPTQENWAQTWVNDAYTLSLVVFQDRPPDMSLVSAAGPNPASALNERLLEVASINDSPTTPLVGLGGGEFLLRAYDINMPGPSMSLPGYPPISGEQQLKIKRNDWICLSGQVNHQAIYVDASGNPQPIRIPIFKWYRVVDCESEVSKVPSTSPQAWERYVSLSGQDWPLPAKDPVSGVQVTWATIVEGVVGVYEKSIRLEYDSSSK